MVRSEPSRGCAVTRASLAPANRASSQRNQSAERERERRMGAGRVLATIGAADEAGGGGDGGVGRCGGVVVVAGAAACGRLPPLYYYPPLPYLPSTLRRAPCSDERRLLQHRWHSKMPSPPAAGRRHLCSHNAARDRRRVHHHQCSRQYFNPPHSIFLHFACRRLSTDTFVWW